MISTALRRVTAAAAVIVVACLIAAAAAVSAHGASPPQRRQISVTTLTHFKVVLTATRGGLADRHPVPGQRAAVPAVHTVRLNEGQPAARACARLLHYLHQALDALTSSRRGTADGR